MLNGASSNSTWPIESEHVGLEKLNRRIEHLSGLRADSSKGYSEGFMVMNIVENSSNLTMTPSSPFRLQCGNYGIGGWYFIHPDFHHNNHYGLGGRIGGNRVSTILTVLEAPLAGGATVWPNAGITVFPEKGSAVWWYNLRRSDIPDQYTMHAACPVLLGQKWIGNKWVGYHAQWDGRKCGLGPMDRFDGPYR